MADFIKAIFVATRVDGEARKWRRAPVNLVKRGSLTALEGNGHTPGRANVFDDALGEVYDDVMFLDVWPETWPRIGVVD